MKFTSKRFDQLAVGDVYVRSTGIDGAVVIVDSVETGHKSGRPMVKGHDAHTGAPIQSRYKPEVRVNVGEP